MEAKKILIIDDEESIVNMLALHLKRKGFEVLKAFNGAEGLQMVRKQSPDIIVCDIQMPGKDGWDVIQTLFDEYGTNKFPILVMTGRDELEPVFHNIEISDYVIKPFEINTFLEKIDNIFSRNLQRIVYLMDFISSTNALGIVEALEKDGFAVKHFQTEREMAEAITQYMPDFVLMEYSQSEKAGDEMIETIRHRMSQAIAAPKGRFQSKIPIVVYTYSGMDFKVAALQAGADCYLGNPESPNAVVQVLWDLAQGFNEPDRKAS